MSTEPPYSGAVTANPSRTDPVNDVLGELG